MSTPLAFRQAVLRSLFFQPNGFPRLMRYRYLRRAHCLARPFGLPQGLGMDAPLFGLLRHSSADGASVAKIKSSGLPPRTTQRRQRPFFGKLSALRPGVPYYLYIDPSNNLLDASQWSHPTSEVDPSPQRHNQSIQFRAYAFSSPAVSNSCILPCISSSVDLQTYVANIVSVTVVTEELIWSPAHPENLPVVCAESEAST